MLFCGREKIFTDFTVVNRENITTILESAYATHKMNAMAEEALWNRYRNKELPVFHKKKEFRKNINNIVNESRALQAVEFYQGYIFGEPIQYVRRNGEEDTLDNIKNLNQWAMLNDKQAQDDELAEYMLVMGVCPRIILPGEKEGGVFRMYTLDPRRSFVVYGKQLGEPALMGVTYVVDELGQEHFTIYTQDVVYNVVAGEVESFEPNFFGEVPIVEYCLNNIRMGIFEPAITIFDAVNMLQSNRLDDVQQFVNNILCTFGAELDEQTMMRLSEFGALSMPEGTDARYLTGSMSQSDIEVLKNDLMSAAFEILGLPSRNGGSSTSDTGVAVIFRDGWQSADAKSKRIENQYRKADRKVLRLISKIADAYNLQTLDYASIDIKFTRRNYENIETKANVLLAMLSNPKIHPRLAFIYCNMFPDPESAYEESMAYYEEVLKNESKNNNREKTDTGGQEE